MQADESDRLQYMTFAVKVSAAVLLVCATVSVCLLRYIGNGIIVPVVPKGGLEKDVRLTRKGIFMKARLSEAEKGAVSSALSCHIGCMMNIIYQVGLSIASLSALEAAQTQVPAQAEPSRYGVHRRQLGAIGDFLHSPALLVLNCYKCHPRRWNCCRPVRTDFPKAVDNVIEKLLEPHMAHLDESLCSFVLQARAAVVGVLHEEAESGLINLPQLVNELLLRLLRLDGLENQLIAQATARMPRALAFIFRFSPVPRMITSVWTQLRSEFMIPPPTQTDATSNESRLGFVISSLVNDMISYEDIDQIHSWWIRLSVIYSGWFICMLLLSILAITVVEHSFNDDCIVCDSQWGSRVGIIACVSLMLTLQTWFTVKYLQAKAQRLTDCILISIEKALLSTLSRDEVLKLIGDMVDVSVEAALVELKPLDWPLSALWSNFGGRMKVMQLVEEHRESTINPAIRVAFDELLQRPNNTSNARAEVSMQASTSLHPSGGLEEIIVVHDAQAAETPRTSPDTHENRLGLFLESLERRVVGKEHQAATDIQRLWRSRSTKCEMAHASVPNSDAQPTLLKAKQRGARLIQSVWARRLDARSGTAQSVQGGDSSHGDAHRRQATSAVTAAVLGAEERATMRIQRAWRARAAMDRAKQLQHLLQTLQRKYSWRKSM